MNIVRENLMTRPGYSPYCCNEKCYLHWPRSHWDAKVGQFRCRCGWLSAFPADFIEQYKAKWSAPPTSVEPPCVKEK